jgi:hypothetical protein
MNVGRFNVGIQGFRCWSKDDVSVSVKDRVSFIMEVVKSNLDFSFPGNHSGFRIGSVNGVVSELPHQEVFFPHRGDDGSGEGVEMLVLEAGPLVTHPALEDLAPAKGCLMLD